MGLLVFLYHFQMIFHNFPDMMSMILVYINTSYKSYNFAFRNSVMPLYG